MIKILTLIPAKVLVKYLPEVIAFILTKAITWVAMKHPLKLAYVIDKINNFTTALTVIHDATADNKITVKEVDEFAKEMKELFK